LPPKAKAVAKGAKITELDEAALIAPTALLGSFDVAKDAKYEPQSKITLKVRGSAATVDCVVLSLDGGKLSVACLNEAPLIAGSEVTM
jgi:hypothetical protein